MDYDKNGHAVQAYPVAQEAQPYQQPYGGQHQYPQATVAEPYNGPTAQPYNGPTAQQAVTGQAGNQGHHVVIVRQNGGGGGQPPPSNHCCIAWLSCLFCCCPIGLFAIFMSSSVNSKWRNGDFEGAHRAAEMAKKASIAAIIIGVVWQVYFYSTESYYVDSNNDSTSSGQGSFNPPPN